MEFHIPPVRVWCVHVEWTVVVLWKLGILNQNIPQISGLLWISTTGGASLDGDEICHTGMNIHLIPVVPLHVNGI